MSYYRNMLHKLPKADVHNHLHLGGSIKRLYEKYSNKEISIPKYYNGLDGMIAFINAHINTIMLSSKDVIFFMENAIESSIEDHVTYLEASVDINLVKFFDFSIEKLIDIVYELKNKYKSQIDFRPDIGINKDSKIDEVYPNGIKCIDSGVFNGIDLYGKELNRKLDGFVEIYKYARVKHLKTKVHIGEFSNCQTIEDAITLLNPMEIQHGIKAVESIRTMNMILNNNIRLNICPQSNISLGSVKNIIEHPIRKLYDHGIKISVNTDDFLLFDSSITDQYIDLLENNIFSFEELENIRKNGFE